MYGAGMRFKAVTLGFVLAGTALGSAALNLGRARGAAWIGQPLELVIPVQIDTAQADGALCAEADVFHGDSRQENSRVQVQVEPTNQPDTYNLRILSSALIDEPVVTVYLRAGCSQKSSRKYVLLADFPSDSGTTQNRQLAPPQVPTVVPVEAVVSAATTANASSSTPAASSSNNTKPSRATLPSPPTQESQKSPEKTPVPVKKNEVKPSTKPDKTATAQAAPNKPASPGKSRLRLDPVDILSERIKSLETPSADKISQADLARDSQKMQQLQADLKSLLDQAVKNEASLATLRERLEKAESDRVPMTIVYALIALLLLCIAALAYLVNKRPRFIQQNAADNQAKPESARATNRVVTQASAADAEHARTEDIDVNLLDLGGAPLHQAGDLSAVIPETIPRYRNFNADVLVDLRQQADFLAKLGKVDDALEVLEGGIKANPVESPLLYLDLLTIANNFSRKTDFRQFRAEFMELFNAAIPEFALFRDEGRKLEAYPALLEHINSQWESSDVLDVIEACILRDPEATESDPFDVAAFRELLKMHAAAIEQHRIFPTHA